MTFLLFFEKQITGFWFFHCHIEFHAELGMSAILQAGQPREMPKPPKGFPTCGSWRPEHRKNEVTKENQPATNAETSNGRSTTTLAVLIGFTGVTVITMITVFLVFRRRYAEKQGGLYKPVRKVDGVRYNSLMWTVSRTFPSGINSEKLVNQYLGLIFPLLYDRKSVFVARNYYLAPTPTHSPTPKFNCHNNLLGATWCSCSNKDSQTFTVYDNSIQIDGKALHRTWVHLMLFKNYTCHITIVYSCIPVTGSHTGRVLRNWNITFKEGITHYETVLSNSQGSYWWKIEKGETEKIMWC